MVLVVKNPPAIQETQETWVRSLGLEDPLEEEMAATPVFLPGKESHGQRSLVDHNPWGRKESSTTEQLSAHAHLYSKGNSKLDTAYESLAVCFVKESGR